MSWRHWLGVIAVAALLAFVLIGAANAHDWYTSTVNEQGQGCCGGEDCQVLPDGAVTAERDGYRVRYKGMIGKWGPLDIDELVPFAQAQPAPPETDKYHLCWFGIERRCFFYPGPGT